MSIDPSLGVLAKTIPETIFRHKGKYLVSDTLNNAISYSGLPILNIDEYKGLFYYF